MQESNSGTNTILIVILILIVVGFGAYWYTNMKGQKAETNNPALQINLGTEGEGGAQQ